MDWDERFDQEDFLFGKDPAPFVPRQARHFPPGARILAVADGEGRNAVWLARQGHRVTSFDISPNAQAKGRRLAAEHGVTVAFHLSGVEDWDWAGGGYDVVLGVFIQFLGPAPREALFRNMDLALRPGGVLALHGFAPRQVDYGTGGPPDARNMYTIDLLRQSFPGYAALHEADYDEEVASGRAHVGTAGLVDFVARKPG